VDDYHYLFLMVTQGMLLWQPVKFEHCSQTPLGTTFTLCSGV